MSELQLVDRGRFITPVAFSDLVFEPVEGPDWGDAVHFTAKQSVSMKFDVEEMHPETLAILFGSWVSVGEQHAAKELLWRLNQHWHGNDPGKPVNWKGIDES